MNRNTAFSSNEYFLKLSQLAEGAESKPPKLDKNIFGFSLGGPIRKDKLFFFGNFEGLNENRETVVTRAVPSNSLRDGVLIYQCAIASACPGGTVAGLTGTHSVPAGSYGLTPAELRRIDPLGIGPSSAAMAYFRQFPSSNQDGRYPGNIEDFRFGAPIDNTFRTYIARADYRLNGSHNFFGRFNKQDDAIDTAPQYPGDPPGRSRTDKNWGTAIGWDSTLGRQPGEHVPLRLHADRHRHPGPAQPRQHRLPLHRRPRLRHRQRRQQRSRHPDPQLRQRPVDGEGPPHVQVRRQHALHPQRQLHLRQFVHHRHRQRIVGRRASASAIGRAAPCPAPADCSGLPAVATAGRSAYGDSLIPLLGIVSQTNVIYNYNIDGSVLAPGAPVERVYGANEFELYMQDSWHLRDNLTVSAGLRYGLYSPPWEVNGQQVAPTVNLGEWFDQRAANMRAGIPSSASETITFVPGGPVNDGPGFYDWDKNNFAPRFSVAWEPKPSWVVRGGYGIVYDRIGAGLASTFDNGGSFGLSNNLDSPFGGFGELSPEVRFTDVDTVPVTYPDAPPAGFPATPETGRRRHHAEHRPVGADAVLARLQRRSSARSWASSYGIEAGYVGRRGRNLLVRRDLAMPLNLTDPASGVDYFTAARQLIDAYNAAGGDVSADGPDPVLGEPVPRRGLRRPDGDAEHGGGVRRGQSRLHHRALQRRSGLRPGLQPLRPVRLLRRTVRFAGRAELDRRGPSTMRCS